MATLKPVLVLDRDDVLVLLRILGNDDGPLAFTSADYDQFRAVGGLAGTLLFDQLEAIVREEGE